MAEQKSGRKSEKGMFRLNLVGSQPQDERPQIVLEAQDATGKSLHRATVDPNGQFEFPDNLFKEAAIIIVGGLGQNQQLDLEHALRYRPRQFGELLRAGTLNIAEAIWKPWRWHFVCVSGRVRRCRRHPWWYNNLQDLVNVQRVELKRSILPDSAPLSLAESRFQSRVLEQRLVAKSLPELIHWPFRCSTVCDGVVEVYRRTCCCEPWIIDDSRIPDLIRDLEDILRGIPEVIPERFPPPPPPPEPFAELPFIKEGSLDLMAVHAAQDLNALRRLSKLEVADYINERPYLACRRYSCSTPVKVAEGFINPDGRFNICWLEWPRVEHGICHDEYAYIVRQQTGPFTWTIYNGVAANIWFQMGDEADLVSYSALARTCREPDPAGDAQVFLDEIGETSAHELKQYGPTGWDRVPIIDSNDGLVFPNASDVYSSNRNWGGTLLLKYKFTEAMKHAPVNARYYRVTVREADGGGIPTGPTYTFDNSLGWEKAVGVDLVMETLGPVSVGGQDNLYKIPYTTDADWTDRVDYHAVIDTTLALPALSSVDHRHLITLEVFDSAGVRLRPNGTAPTTLPGAEAQRAFVFRRRIQAGGSPGPDLTDVPFAALTHLFWWDNRLPKAELVQLMRDGVGFNAECLFLEGHANSTFGIRYRAYVPNQRFQRYHQIWWGRGLWSLYGGQGYLLPDAASDPNPNHNVGFAPDPNPNGASPTDTFAQMLTTIPDPDGHIIPNVALPGTIPDASRRKCSFVVQLTTWSKTTNGADLSYPYDQTGGAFALEITSVS
jgi:hypothetical protein